MRELLQTVAHGTTEYAVITRPNARELEVATASLASELWDAPYREWTKFGFDELFRQEQATGYRGVWYANQKSGDEYVYKYSGGLGTYCAKHNPFAVYCAEVDKTFFCYGGATAEQPRRLLHMVSYFDHRTGLVPRPTILLDKQTTDAHDNPVIAVDGEGYVWIFSTSHGRARPSYVHRSAAPYSIDAFEAVPATYETDSGERAPLDNFSYLQVWHLQDRGFVAFFTHYNDPAARTSMFMTSTDGVQWSRWQRLAAIEEGHYQISAVHRAADGGATAATACNYHPAGKGLNFRTNLYYLATDDLGATWHAADGQPVAVPLTTVDSPALVHDYAGEGLNVYLKDLRFDSEGRPILVFVTSRGYESGPANGPRQWRCARWTGERWDIAEIAASDNNYDMGSLLLDSDTDWRLIAPTEPGPQPFNPGGEVAVHSTVDGGASWQRSRVLTAGSDRNHTYVRRPVGAAPGMQAFWADGHGRRPSESRLYFCDRAGTVFELPREMAEEFARPLPRGPLAWAEDFADPASGDAFVFSDPNAWRRDDGGWLELHRQSDYAPAHRSPLNLAILRTPAVGSFVLELEMQQTGRDYGHRDLCVFFGVQDPEHFYYAHLATAADPNAHHVQIVDAAARRPVTTARSGGVDWGRDVWRCVRVERDVASGSVRVYFDNALEPVLEAADTTFGRGFVGFGSFDDTGRVRRVRLWSTDVDPERTFAGFSSAR
ncbi:MAG: BNR-4 repeat-containing protein [Planctomycetes bacterium]|nr:BNR-4 repeat-containing protein [Planctomycetota bacterium]